MTNLCFKLTESVIENGHHKRLKINVFGVTYIVKNIATKTDIKGKKLTVLHNLATQ